MFVSALKKIDFELKESRDCFLEIQKNPKQTDSEYWLNYLAGQVNILHAISSLFFFSDFSWFDVGFST